MYSSSNVFSSMGCTPDHITPKRTTLKPILDSRLKMQANKVDEISPIGELNTEQRDNFPRWGKL